MASEILQECKGYNIDVQQCYRELYELRDPKKVVRQKVKTPKVIKPDPELQAVQRRLQWVYERIQEASKRQVR